MNSLLDVTSRGWMRSNQWAIGALSVAIPIAVESFVALKKIHSEEGLIEGLKKRVLAIDKKKVAVVVIVAVAVAILFQTGVLGFALAIIKQSLPAISLWRLPLPPQIKATVYPGYLLMSGACLYKAYREFQKEDKNYLRLAMHVTMAAIALTAPIVMELGFYDVRWHHLSLGILCSLTGSRSLELFGSAMVLDSMGYWFLTNPVRFGYDNIFVKNFTSITLALAACTVWQVASKDEKKTASLAEVAT